MADRERLPVRLDPHPGSHTSVAVSANPPRTLRRALTGDMGGALRATWCKYMLVHMKQFLVELDDRCARDLERVAPSKSRKRSEFVRLAIRHAIDRALDRGTEAAYARQPLPLDVSPNDLSGWDEDNALARPQVKRSRGKRVTKSAA
jgi:hypothetical protein